MFKRSERYNFWWGIYSSFTLPWSLIHEYHNDIYLSTSLFRLSSAVDPHLLEKKILNRFSFVYKTIITQRIEQNVKLLHHEINIMLASESHVHVYLEFAIISTCCFDPCYRYFVRLIGKNWFLNLKLKETQTINQYSVDINVTVALWNHL